MSPPIFVCGATGTQGGATARQPLSKGATVHALARDISSPKAKTIERQGVKLWEGDFDNEQALKSAIKGTSAIFLNFMPDFNDFGANLRQAKLIMSIAKEAGAKHVVYTSGVGIDKPERLTSIDENTVLAILLRSKADIEHATKHAGFDYWTILRPGNFMANYIDPFVRMYGDLVETGRWITALRNDTILPMVDTQTIGIFSSAALLDPQRFHEHTITYADEFLAVGAILAKISHATGRELQIEPMSDEEIEAQKHGNPFVAGQLAMRNMAQFVDTDEAKGWGLPLSSFEEYLEREKAAVQATYIQPA
ncbi:Fc.00g106110.m01.CDS01 [Cosmosporella sp. VM-42]